MPPEARVQRVGITGASGRLGTLLLQQLGGSAAPLVLPNEVSGDAASASAAGADGDDSHGGGRGRPVTVLVPFTYNVGDYVPWAGSVGATTADTIFSGAVSLAEEAEAIAAFAAAAPSSSAEPTARLIREPCELDLGDAGAVSGAFAGLDVVIHLAATVHADASWDTVSRNNIDATHNVMDECVRSGVRRLVFASSNHTQAGDLFTSLDPLAEGGLCALRPGASALDLGMSPACDGYYALSKLLGEEMCKYFACRHGLETICLRIGWFKGGHLPDPVAQLEELAELASGPAQDYMRAMWLSRTDALQIFRAACMTTALPTSWPQSATGPWAVAYAGTVRW